MSEPSVKKYFAFSTVFHLLTVIAPFVTASYISRVLGADGIGVQGYTSSFQAYFSMAAALGIAAYGDREISRARDDAYHCSCGADDNGFICEV